MTLPHLRHIIFPYVNIGTQGSCPGSHPYAYYNGQYCCASDFEKFNSREGTKCDGSKIQYDSLCCNGDKFIEYPLSPQAA